MPDGAHALSAYRSGLMYQNDLQTLLYSALFLLSCKRALFSLNKILFFIGKYFRRV